VKRLSQVAAILALFLAVPALVKAAPIDPVFSMEDPPEGIPITSTGFTFSANGLGGGIFPFINQSGVAWNRVDFTVLLPLNSIVTCGPGPFFGFCQVSVANQGNQDQWTLSLIGPLNGGVVDGQFFQINLNDFLEDGIQNPDPNGSGGWGQNNSFGAIANNSTPEPATLGLLACGIAAAGFAIISKRL